jgi:Phospholipase_D-nuclease N-terminal
MKGFVFFFLFFCLGVQCYAEGKVYTDSDLKPEPPIYSKSATPTPHSAPQNYSGGQFATISGGFSQPRTPVFQPKYETTPQPQTFKPINPYPAPQYQNIEQALAEAYTRYTMWMLIAGGIPFLIGLICFVDILRNEFTGNNKIVWFLVVFFLPVIGPILYFFIGTDQKISPEDNEEPVVRLI